MNSRFMTVFKEPLFHFLIFGAVIFFTYSLINDQEFTNDEKEIIVDKAKVIQLSNQFEKKHNRQPLPIELNGMIDEFIHEEVLVREAKKLTLDQNDTVIRRRLLQKIAFLNSSFLANLRPDEGELEKFYLNNIDTYSTKDKLAFEQVFLGRENAQEKLSEILQLLNDNQDINPILTPTFLPANVSLSEQDQIERAFGKGFYQKVKALKDTNWQGPVRSAYGFHIVRITARQTGQPIELNKIKGDVSTDWKEYKEKEILQGQYNKLKAQYTISRPLLATAGGS